MQVHGYLAGGNGRRAASGLAIHNFGMQEYMKHATGILLHSPPTSWSRAGSTTSVRHRSGTASCEGSRHEGQLAQDPHMSVWRGRSGAVNVGGGAPGSLVGNVISDRLQEA